MADTASRTDETAPERFEAASDRALYWTVSFYIAPAELPDAIRRALGAALAASPGDTASLRSIQSADPASRELSDAIEPLFNDISDRERLGRVDDHLFAVAPANACTDILISAPETIAWETEGVRFEASPGAIGPQPVRQRRFWYIHKNGAVSWHLSFRLDYQHSPAHFYFISMLQKVLAPKEFRPAGGARIDAGLHVHAPPPGGTGIAPLDTVRVSGPGLDEAPFWNAVAHWFAADAPHLFDRLARADVWRRGNGALLADPFRVLIRREAFLEIPGLTMPRFRFMFFFQDKDFFRRLLPPMNPETGRPVPRSSMVQEQCYQPFLQAIAERKSASADAVKLDAGYWTWATTRPDYVEDRRLHPALMEAAQKTIPAWEDDTRPDCLVYLFLSGFNQNIIDFMNQDASEILDSTDPIYPRTEDQSSERFFVRFANARALTSYVRSSRSLEAGNDFIGTCPYAFLIHALAVHNEFLARDYERATHDLIGDVKRLNDAHKLNDAAERFYEFRIGPFTDFFNDRYDNVFRYDTEADVFGEVEQRRGTERKTRYLEGIVSNLEKQTADLQARIQKREDRAVTYAVAAVGAFGLFQMALQISEMWAGRTPLQEFWIWVAIIGGAAVVLVFFLVAAGDLFEEAGNLFRRGRPRRGRPGGGRRRK
ncbi:MAG: hypothetical protein SGJ21_00465 [Alphaproteobacteria bacterium]|nr:hypothetical protein [Alphaproteobacteria bacterium]